MEMIEWKEQRFSDISTKEFYEIFKFRSEVFVVEQEILYNDFDWRLKKKKEETVMEKSW